MEKLCKSLAEMATLRKFPERAFKGSCTLLKAQGRPPEFEGLGFRVQGILTPEFGGGLG